MLPRKEAGLAPLQELRDANKVPSPMTPAKIRSSRGSTSRGSMLGVRQSCVSGLGEEGTNRSPSSNPSFKLRAQVPMRQSLASHHLSSQLAP
jgi:hypothetical protein